MTSRYLRRFAFSVYAAASLAACSGTPSFVSPFAPARAAKGMAWIEATAKNGDLLYVSNQGNNSVTVYSYRSRKLVGALGGFSTPGGLCSDAAGDVWVTNEGESEIIEYAHGGTTPIDTLDDGSEAPLACSVDKKTGNLAVLDADDVAVFAHASGSPTRYSGGEVYGDYALGYGARGDLLIDGGSYDNGNVIAFAQLVPSAKHLKQVVLSSSLQWAPPTFVQWDGEFWVVGDATLDWFKVTGNKGHYEGYTQLLPTSSIAQFCIASFGGSGPRGNQLVAVEDYPYEVEFFQYPAGGKAFASIIDGLSNPYGITISKASK